MDTIKTISMRELQKLSSATIEALEHPVPIRNGDRTVALLVPLGRSAERDAAWERFGRAAEVVSAQRPAEEQAALDAYLDDLDAGLDLEEAKRRLDERRAAAWP
jgi:hypothetical protein